MTVSRRLFTLICSLLVIVCAARGIDPVYISEFVASNQNGLTDEDGATSDWIEIYNSGTTPVNLAGWHLTDDPGNLNQWTFPAVSLDPKGFLVVFASQKDRIDPTATLHTNFKLSAGGGYLALVKPDGSIAHEYNPYPAQYDDKPYGFQQTVVASTLIAPGASLKWLVPTSSLPTDATWSAAAFNATGWTTGVNGVGFETTVAGFAFRTYFANVGVGNITTANQVIATASMQTQTYAETRAVVNYLDSGGDGHYAPQSNPSWATGNADNYVVEATGVMTVPAAGVWTFGVNSDDGFQFQVRNVGGATWTTVCSFDGGRGAADTLGTYSFAAAGDYEVRVMIFEGGGGSAGEAFAKQGNWVAWDAGFKLVGDTVSGGLAVKSVPIGAGGSGYSPHIGAGSNLKAAMFDAVPKKSSAYVRYTFTNPGGLASLTMPIRYDDGFVAYLNGTEVARRNAPGGTPTNASIASGNRPPAQALTPENIDLSIAALTPGAGNVLAIHGLNEAASDGDFLIKAELAQYTVSVAATPSYFQAGTPAGFNTSAIYNKVAPVTTSVGRGFFTTAQTVTLATGTAGATIRYTRDGSSPFQLTTGGAIVRDGSGNAVPSPTSGVYSSPLSISTTTTLRYAAFKSGFDPSDSVTQTYIFLSDVINQSPTGAAPSIANPPGASPATTTWPTTPVSGQILDYGMDPEVVNVAPYNGTIINDLKTIPSFSIVTDVPNLFDDGFGIYVNPSGDTVQWERPASLELIKPDGSAGFQVNCGLRVRGGFSRSTGNPKHAFRFFFRDDFGTGSLKYPLFGSDPTGATSFDKFDLRCAQNYSWSFGGDGGNGIFVRDVFNRQTQLDMGQLSSHSGFYHLYLNGQYWGLYNVDERPEANFGASYLGGSPDDYDTIKVAPDNGYTIFATDGNTDAWYSLWSQADSGLAAGNSEQINNTTYQKLVGNNPDGTPNAAYPQLLDAVNVIDYNLCIYWGGNLDAAISAFLSNEAPNNWFGFRDRTGAHGGFRFVLHDSEHTLLNVNEDRTGPWIAGSSAAQGAGTAFSKSTPQYLFQQCIYAQQFRTLFADRVFKHFNNGGALSPTAATARFDALTSAIDRAVVAESARWGDSKVTVPLTRDGNWVGAVANVRNGYLPSRTGVVLAQFRAKGWYPSIDPPVWSQRGGTVAPGATFTLSLVAGQSGTIYYTTDGSDPRRYNVATGQGDIAPTAIAYAGPITVATSTVIRTRVKNGSTWSALDEATFYTTQSYTGLAITEINYNPLPNGAISGDEYEFLELKNTTANTLDLGGLNFTTGISYTFPAGTTLAPGAFYVLARNAAEFHNRYPTVTANAVYIGKLDNGGETLTIAGPTGGTVLSVTYSDAAPWPASADGNGFTAVPTGGAFNSDDGRDWRASAAPGGSPRADDPAVNFAPIVINEALSNSLAPLTDTIELYNPTGTIAAIGDWWLTDDPNTPKKFRIPAGTTIPAGGHVAFNEAQFNSTPGTPPSFALSSAGDDVYLFSGDAGGNLTGYSHGFTFAAAEANVSFGRYVNSIGDEHFPRQISRTFGAPNSGPLVGPLVISEIMYNPYPGYDEFIEIRNISGAPVNLYDPANPANTWKIGGLNWFFPTNQSIPAGGLALIVPIDPATFRTKYNVPAAVPIFGPYSTVQNPASLDNGGERLSLLMPDTPIVQGAVTVVPYDYIDSVRFNDKLPWPVTADGGGPSLQRLDVNAYADDPANWFASGSSPGRDNAANVAPTVALTAPANNASYTLPTNVTFQSTASDTDGTIVKVEYYVDGGKVGESTAGPSYSFIWPATGGIHTVVAKAIDSGLTVTTSTPITIYATSTVTQGLKADYFSNIGLGGAPAGTRTDATVDFTVNNGWPGTFGFPSVTTTNFSVRWSGTVRPSTSGVYTFYTQSDDGVRLYVNGQTIVDNWTYHGNTENSGTITLVANQLYSIVMEFFQGAGGGEAHLLWSGPSVVKAVIPQIRLYPDGPPLIVTQPLPLTCEQGTSASFTVVHSGTAPFSYQWRKGGVNIPGATSQTLSLPYVLLSDAGAYSVLVSNAAGFAISNSVTLNVTFTDTDGDGMQNSWEIANGFNPNSAADAALDADGDGRTNLEEFRAGTNPRDANSKLELKLSTPPSGPGSLLSFTAQPYKNYTIQFKNGLGAASWSKLTDVESSATIQNIQWIDTTAGANGERFYRVITPKQ
jgi:hypothetical protein